MIQKILTDDQFKNQVFQWDKHKKVISLSHPRANSEILFYELGEDFDFKFLRSEPKHNSKPHCKK